MANETPKAVQTESLINPPEKPARKTQSKRGRPKKAAASATPSSLTRTTTRKVARSKSPAKPKFTPPAPKTTMLNRLVNFSVVLAVFVTALAIQRIVPTEPVNTPKVESLPAQAVAAPIAPAPEATSTTLQTTAAAPADAAASVTTPTATPATTPPTTSPAVAATNCNPPATPAPKPAAAQKQIAKSHKVAAPRMASSLKDHATPLNSGGTDDLDNESARQTYMAKSKMATRTPTK